MIDPGDMAAIFAKAGVTPPSPKAEPQFVLPGNKFIVALFIIFVLLLFSRWPSQILTPKLYEEDSYVFAQDSERDGWGSILIPYHGYLLVIPRIVSVILVEFFPERFLPFAFNLSALLITSLVALRIFQLQTGTFLAIASALMIVLVPNPGTGEPFLSLCCLHFFCAILLVCEYWPPEHDPIQPALRGAILFLIGISGPEVIILLPVIGWRLYKSWDRDRSLYWLLPAAVVQIIAGFSSQSRFTVHLRDASRLVEQVPAVFSFYCGHLFSGGVNGPITAIICLLILAWTFFDQTNRNRLHAAGIVFCAVLIITASRMICPGWPNPAGLGSRYVYLLFALIALSLISLLAGTRKRFNQGLIALLLVMILSSTAQHWSCS